MSGGFIAGCVLAAMGWALAAAFASLFFISLGMKQRERDMDALNRYFEKRLKEIACAGQGNHARQGKAQAVSQGEGNR